MSTSLKLMLSSYARVFASVVLALFLAKGADVFSVSAGDLRMWVAAGVASVLPPLIRYLNPKDVAFGKGSK